MQTLVWVVAIAALGLLVVALALWALQVRKQRAAAPLPVEWTLTPRPVFSVEERRVYRLLREALPHHIVLSKLPLVRFCQPSNPTETRFWFELLGAIHVTFAVCSANGRVLAAVDLDTERGISRRAQLIKHSVLTACRVRYMRCPLEHLPSVAELQLLVPQGSGVVRGPLSNGHATHRPSSSVHTVHSGASTNRRAERTALWQDSSLFQDSFFAPDSRTDGFGQSDFGALGGQASHASGQNGGSTSAGSDDDEIAGVVIDGPVGRPTHH